MDLDRVTFLIFALISEIIRHCWAIPGLIDLSQSLSDKKYPEIEGSLRVEANIIQMKNPRGTTRYYTPCDLIPGYCDPRISVAID